ncbi:MAG: DNA-binding protein [Prevotella sp.]|nr:DNA-binding protein [Prevotella sp.]
MAVFYKLAQNTITNSKTNGKWYAHTAIVGTVGLKQMADIIQRNCSMKRSDVTAVLTELPEVMRDLMQQGYRVDVEGLGAFKFQVYSQGTDSVSEFNAAKHIKRVKVIFQPETEYDKSSGTRPKYLTQGVTFADVNDLAAKAALDQKEEEEAGQQVEP